MSQPIGLRGAPLLSLPGFVGPGPARKCASVETGWSYYGLPSGPTTTLTDYRVGVWNWSWSGNPPDLRHGPKLHTWYGPPVATYAPFPGVVEGGDARRRFSTPTTLGYGLNALSYRSAFPRLATPSVSVKPSPDPLAPGCCRVDVRLPHPDAELWVNRMKTAATGTERAFDTPELADGKEYQYELVARWTANGRPVEEARSVVVAGGKSVAVDFTEKR